MTIEYGQIWQLGNHRLMCGDATLKEDIDKLLDGEKATLCLTDPPYGEDVVDNRGIIGGAGTLKYKSKARLKWTLAPNRSYEKIIGDTDRISASSHYKLVTEYSQNQVLFGGNYFTEFLPPHKCWIVWDKQNGKNNNWSDGELAWTSFDKPLKIYQWRWAGMIRKGERRIELKERIHPTQKPVGLIQMILEDFSKEGDSVVDCFAGSGSVLIACEVSNRICYAMELSEDYCEKIIERWETLTGEKAVLKTP